MDHFPWSLTRNGPNSTDDLSGAQLTFIVVGSDYFVSPTESISPSRLS